MPDLAYSHSYRFEAPSSELARMQDQQLEACEALGVARCKLGGFNQEMGATGVTASLDLYVASDAVRALIRDFTEIARDYGGDRVGAEIIARNVTEPRTTTKSELATALELSDQLARRLASERLSGDQRAAIERELAQTRERAAKLRDEADRIASDIDYTLVRISYTASASPLLGLVAGLLIAGLVAGIALAWWRSRRRAELTKSLAAA